MTVLSRDQHGQEHQIEVIPQHGLVALRDDGFVRLFSPRGVVALVMELVGALPDPGDGSAVN
jgi:hypothetical protein